MRTEIFVTPGKRIAGNLCTKSAWTARRLCSLDRRNCHLRRCQPECQKPIWIVSAPPMRGRSTVSSKTTQSQIDDLWYLFRPTPGCCSGTNWSAKSFLGNRWSQQASSFIILQKGVRYVEVAYGCYCACNRNAARFGADHGPLGRRPSHRAERAKLRCRHSR